MSERTDDGGLAGALGLGAHGGMGDGAADAIFGGSTRHEDGQALGAGDYAADRRAGGADDTDDAGDLSASNPFELVTGADEPAQGDDGEAVGASDRDADIGRSR